MNQKLKHLNRGMCALTMACVLMSGTAYAAQTQAPKPIIEKKIEMNMQKPQSFDKSNSKFDEINAKWETLTNSQKEEVYVLKDIEIDAKINIIEKYAELGLIDKSTAEKIKSKANDLKANMRENGRLPFFNMKKSMPAN